MTGKILSIESMGLVDGPGVRTVVFMQGCNLRCKFCHNPDSWSLRGGQEISSQELIEKIKRYKPYYKDNGGVTFSGGEPLLQPDFLIEMLTFCKEENIHTCLDTAGVGVGRYREILNLCDLVLYDVKAVDSDSYKWLCIQEINKTQEFLLSLQESKTPTVVRQVIVPTVNDNEEYINKLVSYVKENIPTATEIELLPYHNMALKKYEKLGIKYPLENIEPMDKTRLNKLNEYLKKIWED